MERQELQWNCKRKQSESLEEACCRYFHDILSAFCYNRRIGTKQIIVVIFMKSMVGI